jgi:hypothetical protein
VKELDVFWKNPRGIILGGASQQGFVNHPGGVSVLPLIAYADRMANR